MTKQKQLKVAFKLQLEDMLKEVAKAEQNALLPHPFGDKHRIPELKEKLSSIIDSNTNIMLKEVSIRTDLR